MQHDPLAQLFSALANWRAAILMNGDHDPEIDWSMKTAPDRRWRLVVTIDGATVVDAKSAWTGQLVLDALRDFRAWADKRDEQENVARLEASVRDMPHARALPPPTGCTEPCEHVYCDMLRHGVDPLRARMVLREHLGATVQETMSAADVAAVRKSVGLADSKAGA